MQAGRADGMQQTPGDKGLALGQAGLTLTVDAIAAVLVLLAVNAVAAACRLGGRRQQAGVRASSQQ